MNGAQVLLWYAIPVCLFALAGPLAMIVAQAGQQDPAGLYVILGTQPAEAYGARLVGPVQAPFAQMIEAAPHMHDALRQAGAWMLPASALAALCGIRPSTLAL